MATQSRKLWESRVQFGPDGQLLKRERSLSPDLVWAIVVLVLIIACFLKPSLIPLGGVAAIGKIFQGFKKWWP
jgi:hypothetical protein